MTTTVKDIIRAGIRTVIRRCYMKRVETNGQYESDWLNITQYVSVWPIIREGFGDVVSLGFQDIESFDISLINRQRKFSDVTEINSFFYKKLTRYKTKFKITLSYIDPADGYTEVLARSWYCIVFGDSFEDDSAIISLQLAPLLKVFQLYTASGISETSGNSSDIVDRLAKKEYSSTRIFDQFIEGANDSERYQISPTTTTVTPYIEDDMTVWDKITDMCVTDDYTAYINDSGNFVWSDKSETDSVKWVFNGAGSLDNNYGVNIIGVSSIRDDIQNLYTRATIQYSDGNYETASDSWIPGDGSNQDIYGELTFSRDLFDVSQSVASDVASSIQNIYKNKKRLIEISTPLIPNLLPRDLVELNWRGVIEFDNAFTLGVSLLGGTDVLSGRLGSIFFDSLECKIVYAEHDLNELISNFTLREV